MHRAFAWNVCRILQDFTSMPWASCEAQPLKHCLPRWASLNPLASSDQCWNCTEQKWGLDLTNLQSFSMDFYGCFPMANSESTMWYFLHSRPSKSIIVHGSGGAPLPKINTSEGICREITRYQFVSWFPNKKLATVPIATKYSYNYSYKQV